MKKNYIAPATEIMNVEMETMIAASPVQVGDVWFDGDAGLEAGTGTTPGSSDSKGHGFDLWDMDED